VPGQRPRLHPGRRADYDIAPIEGLEASTKARFEAAPKDGKLRRFKEFYDGAKSWSRIERIIARVEVGAEGPDTRFIVTNLKTRNARVLYEDVYCRRGQAENHIKSCAALPARFRVRYCVGVAVAQCGRQKRFQSMALLRRSRDPFSLVQRAFDCGGNVVDRSHPVDGLQGALRRVNGRYGRRLRVV